MSRPVVVVTRRLPANVEDRLGRLFDVRLSDDDRPFDARALRVALAGADGVLSTVTDHIDRALITAPGRRARIVANFGVGVDNIDIAAARSAGLVVTNTPGVLTDDTADLAVALMLVAARRIGEGERLLRRGEWTGWRPTQLLGMRLRGATLGVVGLGRIGTAVARRAADGFGMRVLAWTRTPPPVPPPGVVPVPTLGELLSASDVVSLHVPLTDATRGLIGADAIARMRPGAVLVNTARGPLVDTVALAAAVRSGRLAAAALDVYDDEPVVEPYLLAEDRITLVPHLGSATVATRTAMGDRAVDNLEAELLGDGARDRVA